MRTAIELTVLIAGWFAGGTLGVGTVIYALSIGPLIQYFIPLFADKTFAEKVQPASRSA